MRHLVALFLTVMTSAISAALTVITLMGGCFLWPPILMLCVVSGYLCRRSPLSLVCYAFPFSGLLPLKAFEVTHNPPRVLHRIDSLVEVFLLPPSFWVNLLTALVLLLLPLSLVYTGYLRAISRHLSDEELAGAMKSDEGE
jgi:hypothetical protein